MGNVRQTKANHKQRKANLRAKHDKKEERDQRHVRAREAENNNRRRRGSNSLIQSKNSYDSFTGLFRSGVLTESVMDSLFGEPYLKPLVIIEDNYTIEKSSIKFDTNTIDHDPNEPNYTIRK